MRNFYFITNQVKNIRHINYYSENSFWFKYYAEKYSDNFSIYKVNLKNKSFTTDISSKENNKILKINNKNKKIFRELNYLSSYTDPIQYTVPYPFYRECHQYLYNNFAGIDTTTYNKKDVNESLEQKGLIWDVKKTDMELELVEENNHSINFFHFGSDKF